MSELIKTTQNENGDIIVSGRDLYEFLGVKDNYTDWFKRMVTYGFTENVDFISLSEKSEKPTGGRPKLDHAIKLDMAKELSMIQRNEQGKQARQYFIKVEKFWNSPEVILKRAMDHLNAKIDSLRANTLVLERQVSEMQPKALFADSVSASHTSILVGELAKLLKQNGIDTGQKRLFDWLRENGYLIKRKGADYNMPTQRSMDLELFEIKERTISNPDGSARITKTSKVTGKGQIYFINKFLKEQESEIS
ncbi:phage antirepressor KilAC domain-containing protein [Lysinibacillus sp. NPDC048646]|uniref:phage antirepressor KilAC domain-containing protein n=1 Tax=Lysinibacillus sp. NPDC048646 TaxID=3390574 RepID=UPI003CFFB870